MTKYKQVAKAIEEAINSGKYTEKLPTEDVLIELYGASRNTIRNAIDLLVDNARLYRVHGSGIYIRQNTVESAIDVMQIRSSMAQFNHSKVTAKVISIEKIAADEDIAKELVTKVGTIIYHIKRVRYVDDLPTMIEYSMINKEIIPYIGHEIAEGSIFDYIENDLHLKIGFADRYLTAEKLSQEDAELFGLEAGDPTLVNNEKIYLSNGLLYNRSKVFHHYERTKMYVSAKN